MKDFWPCDRLRTTRSCAVVIKFVWGILLVVVCKFNRCFLMHVWTGRGCKWTQNESTLQSTCSGVTIVLFMSGRRLLRGEKVEEQGSVAKGNGAIAFSFYMGERPDYDCIKRTKAERSMLALKICSSNMSRCYLLYNLVLSCFVSFPLPPVTSCYLALLSQASSGRSLAWKMVALWMLWWDSQVGHGGVWWELAWVGNGRKIQEDFWHILTSCDQSCNSCKTQSPSRCPAASQSRAWLWFRAIDCDLARQIRWQVNLQFWRPSPFSLKGPNSKYRCNILPHQDLCFAGTESVGHLLR